MNLFLSILNQLSKNEKAKFFWFSIFVIFSIFLELLSLGLFLPIIKIFFTSEKIFLFSEDFFLNEFEFKKQIFILLFSLILIYVIKNIFNSFLIYYKKKFLSDIQINFTSRIFSYYLNQSYDFFLEKNKPEIIRNIGLLHGYIGILENIINVIIEIFIIVLILSIIFYTNLQIGLIITFFSLIFIFLILKIFGKRQRRYGELINIYQKEFINTYLNSLGSIKDIILQKKQSFFSNHFTKTVSKQAIANVKNSFLLEIPRPIIELAVVFGISGLMFFLLNLDKNAEEITVILTFTIALLFRAIPSITRIIYQASGISFKLDHVNQVHKIFSTLEINPKKFVFKDLDFDQIKIKDLTFNYKKDNDNIIFEGINLSIKKNTTIGIMGPSGSGKSTLIDVICCLLNPKSGGVYLDDKLIDQSLIDSWHNKIGYISQKNYLLNGTILQNIAFGEEEKDININSLNNAIKMSKLNQLINSHSDGLNFYIGEDGINISGGQRQRIVMARTIYKQAKIIFLDEATSALDEQTENAIFEDLRKNFHGKTTLIISTHRKKLLNFADQIIDINDLKKKQ